MKNRRDQEKKVSGFNRSGLREKLDIIYEAYNKKEYIHPDPLEFLEHYQAEEDREVAALIAASLAYGRVDQILKHVATVFDIMKSPADNKNGPGYTLSEYLQERNCGEIESDFRDFKYRFTNGENLASLLTGMKSIITESGSLKGFFLNSISDEDTTVIPALTRLTKRITDGKPCGNLVADPDKGSACKRNNLFLRWLIRKDSVDPGGWDSIPSSMLIVPLDTHMHHAGTLLGFTNRKQADMKTAIEVTSGFREICPEDPVRYDFCLTRFGIRPDMSFDELENMISQIE